MNNFNILLKYSWKQKFQGKSSKIILIIMAALCMIAPIAITLINDFMSKPTNIGVYGIDEDDTNTFINVLNEESTLKESYIFEYADEEQDEDFDIVVNTDEFSIYSKNSDSYATIQPIETYMSSIKQQEFLIKNNLELDFLNKFSEESTILIIYSKDSETDFIYWAISYGGSILTFILLTFVIQLIGAEISEEKSTRAMEIIMTSTTPIHHMLSKIITNVGYIFLNIIIIVISLIVGVMINNIYLGNTLLDISFITDFIGAVNDNFNLLFIVMYIVLFVSTILIASTLAAAIASTVISPSDFAKSVGPLTMFLLIPYMIALFPMPDELLSILSFIPVFSMFLYPTLMLKLSTPIIVTIIIMLINIISTVVIIKLASKLYRYGVLNYSGAPLSKIIKDTMKSNKQLKK